MKLLPVVFLLIIPLVAEAADPVVPGAGSMLQQIQTVTIPGPSSTDTGLTVERKGGDALPPSAPILVRSIRISGQTQFDSATLQALVADAAGQSLTLPQLGEVVARITNYYHRHGYALAQAIIPAQEIQDGVALVEVIEARHADPVSLVRYPNVLLTKKAVAKFEEMFK